MKNLVIMLAIALSSCTTVSNYPLNPHTCEYEGGINIANARLLQIESMTTPTMRKALFDDRSTVVISGQHYDFATFRPILMCVDPKLSASFPQALDDAGQDVVRRYSLMASALAFAPALPIAAISIVTALGISATASGVVGYLHKKFFESDKTKLDKMVRDYNEKVALLVTGENETSDIARYKSTTPGSASKL